MLRKISGQLLSDFSRGLTIYLKWVTPYTSSHPSLPYLLNSTSPDIWSSSTSLRHNRITIARLHLDVCLCFYTLFDGIRIPQLGHRDNGVGPYCSIVTLYFNGLCMKFFRSLPSLCTLSNHPSTGHATDIRTHGNDTTYISALPNPKSTPQVCVVYFLWVLYMWYQSDDAVIVDPHSSQLTHVLFLSLNIPPSPIACRFYAASPCCPHMNPGVHTITFVFPRFLYRLALSNMGTSAGSLFCTQLWV